MRRDMRKSPSMRMIYGTLSVGLILCGYSVWAAGGGEKAESASAQPSATTNQKPTTPADPVIEPTDEGCLADAAVLEDLKRQKKELDSKLKDIQAREADLKAREKVLAEQLKQLAEAREEVTKLDGEKKKANELRVAKLIETLETMNPKSASGVLANVEDQLAVTAMSRLTTQKLAKILNVMEPARSTRLSELLAGVTRQKTESSRTIASGGSESRKGGERENGKSNNDSNARSLSGTDVSSGPSGSEGNGTGKPGQSEKGPKSSR